jgi:D-alanyl-D-alanine carboxypeptidase (penicillin-binding protein 5/6)
MTVDELLRATVIGSANDAATLLGEYVSGSEEAFIARMNERAKELGMNNTNFVNATGLDDTTDDHLTTARDIALMSCELLKHDFIKKYTTVWMDSLRDGATELVNTNKLVRFYEGTTGLKTGTTSKAGCCISASAQRDGLHLVAVVMGSENSDDRFNTAKAMLNYGFSTYTSYLPAVDMNLIKSVPVIGGKKEFAEVGFNGVKPILIKKGQEQDITVSVDTCSDVCGPVLKGQTLGTVTVKLGNETLAEYPITSICDIEKLTLFDSFIKVTNYILNGDTAYPEFLL